MEILSWPLNLVKSGLNEFRVIVKKIKKNKNNSRTFELSQDELWNEPFCKILVSKEIHNEIENEIDCEMIKKTKYFTLFGL